MARSRALLLAFAASSTIAIVLASTVAVAVGTDSDGDGVPDVIEEATQRSVAATSSGDEFNISSRLVSSGLEDQFEVSYKAGTFDVWYEQTGGGSSSYRLELRNLVEWVDTNGNRKIDTGEVVSTTPLGQSAFGNIPVTRWNTTNADGGRVFGFVVRSNTNEITINLTVAQRFMRLGSGRVLTPMEVKMDITISHLFGFLGSNLGLEMRMDTGGSVSTGEPSWDGANGFATNDSAVNVTSGPANESATVFFGWSEGAFADGHGIPVTLTNRPLGPSAYALYLAYVMEMPQPRVKIVHDPTLGVESAVYEHIINALPELQGDVALYVASVVGMAFLVAMTIVVAGRRRKKREG